MVWNVMKVNNTFGESVHGIRGGTWWAEKANPNLNITVRTNHCPFYDETAQ